MLRNRIRNTFYHIGMVIGSFIMLYPLIWLLAASLKSNVDYLSSPNNLLLKSFEFANYTNGWKGFARLSFATFFKNSIYISVMQTIGTVASCTLVAFGFARIQFRTRNLWFALMILTMLLPGQVMMIPRYLLFNSFGWVGTFLPLIVPAFFGGAFNVFLLMQFMKNIPYDMDEAATIDGCNHFQLFSKITLPLVKPAIATVAVMSFMGAWGDFLSALLYLNQPKMYPVAYALKLYSDETGTNYGPMFAMSVTSLVPIIIIFAIFQKSLVEGISTSGIKG